MRYADRAAAGRQLAPAVARALTGPDTIVLGLARGGVPVAYEVARCLRLPLDVLIVRKVGLPGQEELAAGAMAGGDVLVLNPEIAARCDELELERAIERERGELIRRERAYRRTGAAVELAGREVVLVDDGLATGASMRAGLRILAARRVARTVAATPIGSRQTCGELGRFADAVVCLRAPRRLFAVGNWYDDFAPTTDDQVRALLHASGS